MEPLPLSREALAIPDRSSVREAYTLSRKIPAVQLIQMDGPHGRLGGIVHLPMGARLDICGDGYNESTVKVRCEETFYFVFLDDLRSMI